MTSAVRAQMDRHYQVHYLPALLSYAVNKHGEQRHGTTQPESYHRPDSFCWNSPQDSRLEKTVRQLFRDRCFLTRQAVVCRRLSGGCSIYREAAVWRRPSDSCFQTGIRQAFNTPQDSRTQAAVRRRIFFPCGGGNQAAVSRQVPDGQFQQKVCHGIYDPHSVG